MDSSSQPSEEHQANHQSGDQQPSAGTTPVPAPAPTPRVRKTILDLARYRLGQRVYWIVFRMERGPEFHRPAEWVKREHPWMLWRYKIMPWSVPMKPPRAHPVDAMAIMMLCGQKPKIEPFRITAVERSENSGEFFYTGPRGVRMPEGLLFRSKKAARREIARMARMFAAWTGTWEDSAEEKKP